MYINKYVDSHTWWISLEKKDFYLKYISYYCAFYSFSYFFPNIPSRHVSRVCVSNIGWDFCGGAESRIY